MRHIRPALAALVLLTVLTGIAYPALVTFLGQSLFPDAANGSLVRRGGAIVGSGLIGQSFADPKWFWGRPSATTPSCNAASSSGSNLGPLNPALADAVTARIAALRAADPDDHEPIPVDLVTASASGLDPEISPAAARFQAARVAKARGIDAAKVRDLVERSIEGRTFGILGEPRVNVLRLNLALDEIR